MKSRLMMGLVCTFLCYDIAFAAADTTKQLQAQMAEMHKTQQQQIKTLNTKLQAQLKDMHKQFSTQIQQLQKNQDAQMKAYKKHTQDQFNALKKDEEAKMKVLEANFEQQKKHMLEVEKNLQAQIKALDARTAKQ